MLHHVLPGKTVRRGSVKRNRFKKPGPIGNTRGVIVPKIKPNLRGANPAPTPKPTPKEDKWWEDFAQELMQELFDIVGEIPQSGDAEGSGKQAKSSEAKAALKAVAKSPSGGNDSSS